MADPFGSYRMEVEATLTWFPIRTTAPLKEVRMRGASLVHSSAEPVFQVGNHIIFTFVQAGADDVVSPNGMVGAFIEMRVDDAGDFEVEYELIVGGIKRSKRLRVPPDSRLPFMVYIAGPENDDTVAGTAAALQGVIVTTRPVGAGRISILTSEIVKVLARAR